MGGGKVLNWGILVVLAIGTMGLPGMLQASSTHEFLKMVQQTPLKMPRFNEWQALSPKARDQVIEDWQNFLLAQDDYVHGRSEKKTVQWLFDNWLSNVEAGYVPKDYCINQGVIRPISECDTKLGMGMHNFDTSKDLASVAPKSTCPAGEMPCGPAFGFSADGNLLCSSKNLTRDCARKSQGEGVIKFSTVMTACAAGTNGGVNVDCKALKAFFDKQMALVESLCKTTPKRYACSILKLQMEAVKAETEETLAAATNTGALEKFKDAMQAAANVSENSSGQPCTEDAAPAPAVAASASAAKAATAASAPKTAASSASAPAPAALPAISDKDCTARPAPTDMSKQDLDSILATLEMNPSKAPACQMITLPDQKVIHFAQNKKGSGMSFQMTPKSKPVILGSLGFIAVNFASNALADKPYNVPAQNILAAYFPKEEIAQPGTISTPASPELDGKPHDFKAHQGWTTPDGTKILYTVIQADTKAVLALSIQRPGQAKADVEQYDLSKLLNDSK